MQEYLNAILPPILGETIQYRIRVFQGKDELLSNVETTLIPIAWAKFTNRCACRILPLPALSSLIKGGEGRGEGGFEADAFTNFGSAIGIIWEGILRACLLAELPSRAFLLSCERDARAPGTRCAGNAGVPPAMPTAREKTYPFEHPDPLPP